MSSDPIEPRSDKRSRTKVRNLTPDDLGLVDVSQQDIENLAEETGFDTEEIERWVRAIERKPQLIFYGPPGTGKTHMARELSDILTSGGEGFTETLQFHSSYSYADFIEGIRPVSNDDDELRYPVVKGRFLDFCDRARELDDTCVLILDEINRANLSETFGELMYLLEYRNESIQLAQKRVEDDDEPFSIPENVLMLGTMNTADRSIALVDFALRRRFSMIPLWPNFDVLRTYHEDTSFDPDAGGTDEGLVAVISDIHEGMNDRNFEIGITYFLRDNLEDHLEDIWKLEIEPYLEEYWFDAPERVDQFRWGEVEDRVLP